MIKIFIFFSVFFLLLFSGCDQVNTTTTSIESSTTTVASTTTSTTALVTTTSSLSSSSSTSTSSTSTNTSSTSTSISTTTTTLPNFYVDGYLDDSRYLKSDAMMVSVLKSSSNVGVMFFVGDTYNGVYSYTNCWCLQWTGSSSTGTFSTDKVAGGYNLNPSDTYMRNMADDNSTYPFSITITKNDLSLDGTIEGNFIGKVSHNSSGIYDVSGDFKVKITDYTDNTTTTTTTIPPQRVISSKYYDSLNFPSYDDSFIYSENNMITFTDNFNNNHNNWDYNANGFLIKKSFYNSSNLLTYFIEYEYNINNQLIKRTFKNSSNDIINYNIYSYDINNIIKIETFNNLDVLQSYFTIEYLNNIRIKLSWFNSSDILQQYASYEYLNDLVSNIKVYDSNNLLQFYLVTEYNAYNNVNKFLNYNNSDELQGTTIIEYENVYYKYNSEIINDSIRCSGWPIWF